MSESENNAGKDSTDQENQRSAGLSANEDGDKIEDKEQRGTHSPIKLVTVIVLVISFLFLGWYIYSDRYVPYTDQAIVNGLMIPIVPRVSGYITRINVRLHSQVRVGDTLFQIDPRPYLLAVEKSEANLAYTAQTVAARTASVKSATGRLGVARAQLDRAQRNWDRVQKVLQENPGALSLSDRDQAETALSQATEQVASAEADLERTQQSLGVSGEGNPQFRSAVKALEQAQLDLAFTTVIAIAEGIIESFSIDLGYYATPGQPLATLVSERDIWIQADLKENNISNIKPGDKVEFSLDVAPGKVFPGKVRSIGYGVSTGNSNRGDLPSVSSNQAWLRDPQRFPVIVSFDTKNLGSKLRLGGQVDVIVYTGDHGFLNAVGRFRIRLLSWLSYAR
jgi:multidrug resistance efflux pump